MMIFVGIILSGFEPFVPSGSVVLSWAAAVGVRRRDWWGMAAAFSAGLFADVLTVGRLGTGSLLALGVWFLSGLIFLRLDRPRLVAAAASTAGNLVLGVFTRQGGWGMVVWQIVLTGVIVSGWTWLLDRQAGIRLRQP